MEAIRSALVGLLILASTSLGEWSNDVWVGEVTESWRSFNTLPRLKSVIDSPNFATYTNQSERFYILSTYYGSDGADEGSVVRQLLVSYLPTDKVDVHQFRLLTGNGDPKRVSLAVKSVLRYGTEMFQEKNLLESMRINVLYLLFLSFGSSANLNLADTSYANDVFVNSGGSMKTMRVVRKRLLETATLWNKRKLALEGKSFVGPGKLAEANALVEAMNTGTNWIQSLSAMGISIDQTAFSQCAALALQVKADISTGGVINEPRTVLLEIYLGTKGYNGFIETLGN